MTTPAPTVRSRDLTMTFGRTRALDGVSFELVPGVTGLLGPNGAGKTTLLRVLATVSAPDAGSLVALGLDPRRTDQRLDLRGRLGYMPQEPGFHARFTAFEFVDYVAILKELHQRRARHEEVRRVLELVELGTVQHKKIKALSGGMRRRVALAQALLGDPDLLILDEPTAGLDPEQRLRFRELVGRHGEGRTVLLSTHQTEDVVALCQQVMVLHLGQLRFTGTPQELTGLARGHVWHSHERDPGALGAWRTGTGLPLPIAALTLEAAALLTVTLALAAAGSRLAPERRGGVVAAPALLALATAASLLPARLTLHVPPDSAEWDSAHQRWTALLGFALVAFLVASRDPAHRRLPRQVRALARGHPRRSATAAHRPAVQRAEQQTTKSA